MSQPERRGQVERFKYLFDLYSNRMDVSTILDLINGSGCEGEESFPTTSVDENSIVITVDMPGVAIDDVDITENHERLYVRGKRTVGGQVCSRTYASYSLGGGLDLSAIEAKLDLGVLTIRIPRVQKPEPKKIQVKAG